MSNQLVPVQAAVALQPSVDEYSNRLTEFIGDLGLPTVAVTAPIAERRRVVANLPDVVGNIPADRRSAAMYMSKFVTACTGGLFDAALNYLWDETVVNLREKVKRFDLGYFYAAAIDSEDQRKGFKTEEDLVKLDDWALIRGCRQIGILSDVGFRHLDFIREMRNWASAAHPNHTELTGLQLSAWLETCIREVLIKEPEGYSVEARTLMHNLRIQTLSASDVPAIEAALQRLPHQVVQTILRTIFGMFNDPKAEARVKDNIRLVVQAVWGVSAEEARYEAGLKYATFSANGDVARKAAAREFLERVDGLGYLHADSLAVELNEQLDNLSQAHHSWGNYRAEVPYAKALARLVPPTGKVPPSVLSKYVRTLLLCRIGDAGYGDGVSSGAGPYYDELFEKMQEREILEVAKLLGDGEVASRFQFPSCVHNFKRLVERLRPKVSNVHLASALDMISGVPQPQMRVFGSDQRYRLAVQAVVL